MFGSVSGLGPMFFMIIHTSQIIKTIVLIGDAYIEDNLSVCFLQGGFGLDLDFIPWKEFPEVKIKQNMIKAE